jgi:hypothetical protein
MGDLAARSDRGDGLRPLVCGEHGGRHRHVVGSLPTGIPTRLLCALRTSSAHRTGDRPRAIVPIAVLVSTTATSALGASRLVCSGVLPVLRSIACASPRAAPMSSCGRRHHRPGPDRLRHLIEKPQATFFAAAHLAMPATASHRGDVPFLRWRGGTVTTQRPSGSPPRARGGRDPDAPGSASDPSPPTRRGPRLPAGPNQRLKKRRPT